MSSKYIVNLALLLISIIFAFVLLELVISVLYGSQYSSNPEQYRISHEIKHHGFKPDSYGVLRNTEFQTEFYSNSLGLRDREIGAKTKYRILVLGDSFTEGVGVPLNESIPKQLESMLSNAGYSVEVINGGISSYSPILEYIYLENDGVLLSPDLVILNLDLTDVQDDYGYEKTALFENGEITAVPGSKTDPSWRSNIEYLCNKYRLNSCFVVGRFFLKIIGHYDSRDKTLREGDINGDRWLPARFNLSAEAISHFNRTFSYIKKAKEFSDSIGARFILVTYPHGFQVNEKEVPLLRKVLNFDDFPVYSLDFFSKAAGFAGENNITYIDTYYIFNRSTEFPLYYQLDGHMTAKGYRLVAQGIYESLTKDEEFLAMANG